MYATIRPFEARAVSGAARARWLLVALVSLAALLAMPRLDRAPLPPSAAAPAPRLAKLAGPLSARLRALAASDWSATRRGAAVRALGLPEQGFGSLLLDRAGDPLVYIRLASIDAPALAAIERAGARVVHASARYGVVTAAVAPGRLAALAALPGVAAIQEALAPAGREYAGIGPPAPAARAPQQAAVCPSGATVADGDTQLRAAAARSQYRLDGRGVTVGVLSGSYDVSAAAGLRAENDIASGDLPGPGNPCGYTAPVQVLAETRVGAGRDEGRAMLQVVHDIAPGATLAFATASDGLYAFADNIRRLRYEARADVIVDDYYYPEEPMFQDGPINMAIREVTQDGAIYVTAGGNIHAVDEAGRPIGSYEAPAYRPTACPTLTDAAGQATFLGLDCHDFDPRAGANPLLAMKLPPGGLITLNFQWSEPWFGVATDMDVYLVDAEQHILAQSIAGLGAAPAEFLGYINASDAAQTVSLVVARVSGGAPRFKFTVGGAAITSPTISHMQYANLRSEDIFGPTITDHALARDAITVGAALYSDPRRPAAFSSYGPGAIYWAPAEAIAAAPALPAPEARAKPDILATSGARTTFFGRPRLDAPRCSAADPANAVCRFFGTSASAPHVAGVLALMKQRAYQLDRNLDAPAARQALARSARAVRGDAYSRGAGLADALGGVAAVEALPARPPAAPAQLAMPALVGLTELQARAALLRLGVPADLIVSDYQDQAKLGDLFARVPAYQVVSSLPVAGAPLTPGAVVVLGVRGPDTP